MAGSGGVVVMADDEVIDGIAGGREAIVSLLGHIRTAADTVLEEINTRPNIFYLAKVRNMDKANA